MRTNTTVSPNCGAMSPTRHQIYYVSLLTYFTD